MAQLLTDLKIDECSLVDNPSCASTDPKTGKRIPRSVVAIWKRDDSGDYLNPAQVKKHMDELEAERRKAKRKLKDDPGGTVDVSQEQKKEKKMKFKKILKSGTVTRDQICDHVAERALKIAKRRGVEPNSAILEEAWLPYYQLHEDAPVAVQKRAERMVSITKAEVTLDERARALQKKNPAMSYAKAVQTALEADPSLYSQYEQELRDGGPKVEVSEPQYGMSPQFGPSQSDHPMRKSGSDDGEDECPECGEDVDEDDSYCSSCGTDLEKARKAKRAKRTA